MRIWSKYPTEMFLSPGKRFKNLFRFSICLKFYTVHVRNSRWPGQRVCFPVLAVLWRCGARVPGLGLWPDASSFHSDPTEARLSTAVRQPENHRSLFNYLLNRSMLIFLSVLRSHLEKCCSFFFFFKEGSTFYLFIYLWLCWVFVSVRGLSPVAASGGHSSSPRGPLSITASLAAEHGLQTRRLSNCGSRA